VQVIVRRVSRKTKVLAKNIVVPTIISWWILIFSWKIKSLFSSIVIWIFVHVEAGIFVSLQWTTRMSCLYHLKQYYVRWKLHSQGKETVPFLTVNFCLLHIISRFRLTSAITAIWLWPSSIWWKFWYDAIFRRSLLVN